MLKEVAPLITILTDEPAPPVELIDTPETFPAIEFRIFSWATLVISSPVTLLTEYPSDFSSRLIPKAVTTNSSSVSISSSILIFITLLPPIDISTDL